MTALPGSGHRRLFLDVFDHAAIAFEFHFHDGIEGEAHFLEPRLDRLAVIGFQHAASFAFAKVDKAAVSADVGVVLRRVGQLADLFPRNRPRRYGMGASF